MVFGSQPVLYSRDKYLFAFGILVICLLAASYFNKCPDRKAIAYKLMASVSASASMKLPGYCLPLLQESANNCNNETILLCSYDCSGGVFVFTSFFLWKRRGFCTLNPARILPFSPTNIIPSAGNSSLIAINSSGRAGRMPPSYQHRSTGGLPPLAGYLNLTEQAIGNEKSFRTWKGTTPLMSIKWLRFGSITSGEVSCRALKTVHRL